MGSINNSFRFGTVDSADYNLLVAGDGTFNAPERDVDTIEIPGRNGDLLIDKGRFKNITVEYTVYCYADDLDTFRTQLRNFRNALSSQKGYQKLTDTFHPDEYRLGTFISGFEAEPVMFNTIAEVVLKFDCKPQRFLLSGDEPITLGEWGETETYSGSIVSFDGTETTAIKSLKVNITPKQSGSGDPSPSNVRPISGYEGVNVTRVGKNLLKNTATTQTYAGITYTVNADGTITANGTATNRSYCVIWFDYDYLSNYFKDGTYILSGCPSGGSALTYALDLQAYGSGNLYDTGEGVTINTANLTNQPYRFVIDVKNGTTLNNAVFKPMLRLANTSADYEPYQGTSYPISLGQTVYGGVLDVMSGKLKSYPFYSSYNGETISGEWICDRAVYSEGTTPPIGSQVVDMSGNGTEYNLEPTEVNTLLGTNNIWADAGTVEVEVGENPNILVNPTPFESCPVFEVEGSGTLSVNNISMTIANNGTTIIDSEMMEAYEEENGAIISRNDMVSGEFPTLKEGNNNIGAVGLTSVKVKPKWWEV